jgi:hypothetical protein
MTVQDSQVDHMVTNEDSRQNRYLSIGRIVYAKDGDKTCIHFVVHTGTKQWTLLQ